MVRWKTFCEDRDMMPGSDRPVPEPPRPSVTELSAIVRRRTRDLAQLRTRAARLQRMPGAADSPLGLALEELLVLATGILQDLAGAEMECDRRLQAMRQERERAEYLLDRIPIPCVAADDGGRIIQANRAAALLLNVSTRHLVDQQLLHFSEDRESFMQLLFGLRRDGAGAEVEVTLRPRERQSVTAHVQVIPRAPGSSGEWLWFFEAGAARERSARRLGLVRSSTRRGVLSVSQGRDEGDAADAVPEQ
jgi:PAS domain-containing protein